jgi:hypothetical protein
MNPDAFRILRAADPAADMPEPSPEEHERLRRTIIATQPDAKQPPARRSRRRIALFASVAGAVILLGGTGVYAANLFLDPIDKGPNPPMSAEQWKAEYEKWTHRLPLPAGTHWRGFRDPDNASTSVGAGHLDAVFEAMGHWTREWMAAYAAGDAGRVATAEAWVGRLRATIPTITDEDTAKAYRTVYGTESMAGIDKGGADNLDDAIAKAKAGDFDVLKRFILGYTYWPTPEPTPSPLHYLGGLSSSGYHSDDDMNTDYGISGAEAWAEYTWVLKRVGVPAGMDASGERLSDPGYAFIREAVKKHGPPTSPLWSPVTPHDQLTDADYHHTFGEGFEEAFDDLWSLWWREWAAGAKAGSRKRVEAAAAATARLEALVPHTATHYTQGHELRVITWTLEPEQKRDLERLAAQARAGDMRGIQEWLDFQVWNAWIALADYYVK